MPLSLPYTYRETEDGLTLTILGDTVTGGLTLSKLDIFAHGAYIRVFYPPVHVLHLDLHDAIDPSSLRHTVEDGGSLLVVAVDKTPSSYGMWPSLLTEVESKAELAARREAFIDAASQAGAEKSAAAKREAAAAHRDAVQASLDEERAKRARVQERRQAEVDAAMQDVYALDQNDQPASTSASTSQSQSPSAGVTEAYPPVREKKVVTLSFSERAFPTPARASKVGEEEAYLESAKARAKAKAKGTTTALAADESGEHIADASAQWLKVKGDEFLLHGDVPSALNAYDRAIEIDPEFSLLFSNRSICQLRLSRFDACISDVNQALALGDPDAPSPFALVRRGTAYLRMGKLPRAAADYVHASSLLGPKGTPGLAQDTARLLWKLSTAYRDHAQSCLSSSPPFTQQAMASLQAASDLARNPQESAAIAASSAHMLLPIDPLLAAQFKIAALDALQNIQNIASPTPTQDQEDPSVPLPTSLTGAESDFLLPWSPSHIDAIRTLLIAIPPVPASPANP